MHSNYRKPKSFISTISYTQRRWMTSSKRVQDRSKLKRVHSLEIATQKHKILSKILSLFEILHSQPEHIIPLRNLDHHRKQINLPKPHKISDFLRKSPNLFELYKDPRGVVWCGMTEKAESLVDEEKAIIENCSDHAAEYVTRMLMMSVEKRLALDKIVHFRRDLGLPVDFRKDWVHRYPDFFRVVRPFGEGEFLELVSWEPRWAITELEKKVRCSTKCLSEYDDDGCVPVMLSLAFPLKFPENYKKVYRYGGKIDHFQRREYLSPYADAGGLKAGSLEFDKRAVAVMHELLSFTIEKRLVTDYLTHFRREFVMPQKLMRLLLKHFGIFYVSERGKRFSVFLTEAYEGSELIEKHPLVVWREKVLSLVGYRGKKKKIESFEDASDVEDNGLFGGDCEDDSVEMEVEQDEAVDSDSSEAVDSDSSSDVSETEIEEVHRAYNN